MKKIVSVILALCLVLSVLSVMPIIASADTAETKPVYVGIINHFTYVDPSEYQIRYWSSETSGDAKLTATGLTTQYVVDGFWDNDPQIFNIYQADVPADSTGFKLHRGDDWFNGYNNDAVYSKTNCAYLFNYDSADRVVYGDFDPSAQPSESQDPSESQNPSESQDPSESQNPSESQDPSQPSESQDPSQPEPAPNYYLVGTMNDWTPSADYNFAPRVEGEYQLLSVYLKDGDQIKVVKDGDVWEWYPDGMDNDFVVEQDGFYNIYFRPDGQEGIEAWWGYFKVLYSEYVPTEPATEEASEDSSESQDPSQPASASEYYLVGSMNGWTTSAAYNFEPSVEGEYQLLSVYLKDGDLIKVVETGDTGWKWYPDGMDNNFVVDHDGYYNIYFRPDGQGSEAWYNGYFYVEDSEYVPTEPSTEEASEDPSESGASVTFTRYSISLKDEIAVNFYATVTNSDGEEISKDRISAGYSYGDETYSVTMAEPDILLNDNATNEYKFSCRVNARAMTDEVALTVFVDNEAAKTDSYRVVDYCADAAAVYNNDDDLKNLLCATLAYGGAVQTYYGYHTGDNGDNAAKYIFTVNSTWTAPDAPATLTDNNTSINTANTDISYLGATLSTTGKTVVRLYFMPNDPANAPNTVIKIGEEALEWHKSNVAGRGWYVEIALSAKDIFNDISLTIGNNASVYNAANYYNYAMSSSDAKFTAVQPVLAAMYNYSTAASSYSN